MHAVNQLDPLAVLPGEGTAIGSVVSSPAQRADAALVESVLAEVEVAYAAACVAVYQRVAEIVLERFFDGDLEAMTQRARHHASLAALLRDPRLRVPPGQMWYAIHLLPQLRQLGKLAAELPMSHHRILLHVRNPEVKLQLAVRAQRLSKRELEAEVKRWRTGRAPVPVSRAPGRGGAAAAPVVPPAGVHGASDVPELGTMVADLAALVEALSTLGNRTRLRCDARTPDWRHTLRRVVDRLDELVDDLEPNAQDI